METDVGIVRNTTTFSPPIVLAAAEANVGDELTTSGTATLQSDSSAPSLSGTGAYTATAVVEAIESVTVSSGEFDTLRLRLTVSIPNITNAIGQTLPLDFTTVTTYSFGLGTGEIKLETTALGQTSATELAATNVGSSPIAVAVLPGSRSVAVAGDATAFATTINSRSETANDCGIAPLTDVPADFSYQTTNAENEPAGAANMPADIAGGGGQQSYVMTFSPSGPIEPTDLIFSFKCKGISAITGIKGVNTLQLSVSNSPTPDVVALAATDGNTGIVNIPSTSNIGAFAVSTINLGSEDSITATVEAAPPDLPITLSICETDLESGICINPTVPDTNTVTTTTTANSAQAFAVIVRKGGRVELNPATTRIFVNFSDSGGIQRGSTSVAVRAE